jgi:hypothetical protein
VAAAKDAGITPERAAENMLSAAAHETSKGADVDHDYSGTVLKADEENRFVLMVAYSANKMPHRGADRKIDVASPDVLEKACWRFMDNGHQVGMWHERSGGGRVVENSLYRNPIPWVQKCPDGSEQVIKEGDWIVGMILDEDAWGMFKAGLIGGASPQGTAGRKDASPETLARMRSDA